MPSQLDLAIDATINRLMTDDGPLTVTYVEKFGVQLPMLAKAPGNMADYLAFFCATHADKEFLVDGDIRLSFGETYAAARALARGWTVAAVALCCPWAPTHGTDHTRGRLRAAGVHVPDAWCPMEYAP